MASRSSNSWDGQCMGELIEDRDRNIRPALRQTGGHGDLFAFVLLICL